MTTPHAPLAISCATAGVLRRADEIVDAAASVFAERGYHGTSTQAIADVLGMRQAEPLLLFPVQGGGARARVRARRRRLRGERRGIVAGDAGTPLDKLTRLIAAHLAPNESKRDYVKVFINERRYLPDASRRRIGRKSRRIERCFERGDPRRHRRRQHARRRRCRG